MRNIFTKLGLGIFLLAAPLCHAQTKVGPQQGGTGINTVGQTGCPSLSGGVWSIGACGGGGASATVENVFSGAGTINYTHNLGTLNPLYSCYARSGASTFTVAEVDTNNVAVTTPGASDLVCAFVFAPSSTGPPTDFAFTASPTSTTLTPALGTSHPTFNITQTASGGYSAVTTYSQSSSPSGITGVYSPTTITASGTSTLTTSIPYNQASGLNTLTLTGVGGGKTHTQSPTITIATTNDNLVEGWPANEGSGSTLHTVSASGDNLTGTNVTWTTPTGFPVAVATFNGSTSLAVGANQTNTNFDGTAPFSVCAWLEFAGYGTGPALASTLDPSNNFVGWELGVNSVGGPVFFLVNNFGSNNDIQVKGPNAALSLSTAQHECATYNGTKTAAGVVLYVNGASVANTVTTDGLTGSAANTLPVTVGARHDGTAGMAGSIGYVRVYNRVLTSGEVSTLFAAGPQ